MKYGEDYFERGVQAGVSCYENYRWLPEHTIPLAEAIVRFAGTRPGLDILDFGCAKGFLVKALREMGFNAYGCDISSYAIEHCDPSVSKALAQSSSGNYVPWYGRFDLIIAKDVLEHIDREELDRLLPVLGGRLVHRGRLFVAVPLATHSGGPYVLAESELDKTHVIREDLSGWQRIFEQAGFKGIQATYKVPGVGDRHTDKSNCIGFFLLES